VYNNLIYDKFNTDTEEKTIGREEDLEYDVTNRRFDIWVSGIEVFSHSPVVGTSFRNIDRFAADKAPDSYIVKNRFYTFHNVAMDVLVSQGIIGLLIAGFFAIKILADIIKFLRSPKDEYYQFKYYLLIIVAVIVVGSLFMPDLPYINTPSAFVFWLSLGYFSRVLKSAPRSGNKLLKLLPVKEVSPHDALSP
jgi:O-antigen ligase